MRGKEVLENFEDISIEERGSVFLGFLSNVLLIIY